MRAHLGALGCERFEIVVIDARDQVSHAVLTADEAVGQIERLAALNRSGHDVLVRPASGLMSGLVLIDDVTAEGVRRLQADGYSPVLLTGTLDGRYQAWVRLSPGTIDPGVAAEAARVLQARYALTDQVAQLGPLAGFIDHTGARPARGEREQAPAVVVQASGEESGRVTPAAERLVAEAQENAAAREHVPPHGSETSWGAGLVGAFAEEMHRDEPRGADDHHNRRRRRSGRQERGGRDER